eukprot:scaffold68005_cov66-Phaeocystis_antarctica.AAC.2
MAWVTLKFPHGFPVRCGTWPPGPRARRVQSAVEHTCRYPDSAARSSPAHAQTLIPISRARVRPPLGLVKRS